MRGILCGVAVVVVSCGAAHDGTHAPTQLRGDVSLKSCGSFVDCGAGEQCTTYLLVDGAAAFCAARGAECAPVNCPEENTQCVVLPDTGHVACLQVMDPLQST